MSQVLKAQISTAVQEQTMPKYDSKLSNFLCKALFSM